MALPVSTSDRLNQLGLRQEVVNHEPLKARRKEGPPVTTRVMFIAPAADLGLREARFNGGPEQTAHGDEGDYPEDELEPSGVREATAARGVLAGELPRPRAGVRLANGALSAHGPDTRPGRRTGP